VRDELEAQGLMFQTSVDSEIILNLLAQPTLRGNDNNLSETMGGSRAPTRWPS